MTILTDIGGTHVRFARLEDTRPVEIIKYETARFDSLGAAVEQYAADTGTSATQPLRVATAARHVGDRWRFNEGTAWDIVPAEQEAAARPVETIMNDFEAATWGLAVIGPEEETVLRPSRIDGAASHTRLLTGPGTGLGFAYLDIFGDGRFHVRSTFGAHLPAAAVTQEQWAVITALTDGQPDQTLIFEELVSGRGLFNIYAAICRMEDARMKADSPVELFNHLADPQAQRALRLFHEFFGTFVATAVVSGHALGGVYLTGGVTDRLIEAGHFDQESFERGLAFSGAVPVVHEAMSGVKISHVKDPYLALRGLIVAGPS